MQVYPMKEENPGFPCSPGKWKKPLMSKHESSDPGTGVFLGIHVEAPLLGFLIKISIVKSERCFMI
jgi:hypothetical protein